MTTRLVITPLLMLSGVAVLANGWAGIVALLVLSAAVLVPYLLILGTARTRLPLSLVATLPVLAVMAASVLTTDRVGIGWLRAPIDSVAMLLTAPRPAPPTLELLLPGLLLCVVVGTWVGVRAARNGGGFAAMLGAAVLYVCGALLTAGMADRFGVLAALMVLLAVVGWIARDRAPIVNPASARKMPRGAPLAVIAIAGAAVAATLAPSAGAFEPRRLVTPPSLPLVEPNPLPLLAAYAEQGDVELLRYTGNETRLHLVTLADFDGAVWRANGRYQPVGAVAQPPSLPAAPRRTTTTTEVTVSGLDSLWLPTPGVPDEVSLPDARVDNETGSLALPQGLNNGLRYRVRAASDDPDMMLSVAEVPAAGAGAARYLQIPRMPNTFHSYAQLTVQTANTPLEQAVLLETEVRQGRRFDTRAPDGSSYARLANFLFGNTAGVGSSNGAQSGTSEQFAAAFAVLARAVGLPSRLRAGFRPGEQDPKGGGWVVRGRHVLVWPEIYFSGQGWIPFDPTPSDQDMVSTAVADLKRQALEKAGGAPPPPSPATVQPSRASVPTAAPARSTPPSGTELAAPESSPLFGAVGIPVGVLVFLFGLLLLLRTLRSLRHRRAGARGAWSEVLDLLPLLKIRPPRWHTADKIATELAEAVPAAPPHPAHRLAEEADRAAFASSPPAAVSWGEMRRLRQAASRTVPWYRRVLWPVDPRPLLRR